MDQVQKKALLSRYFFTTFLICLCVYMNCLKGYPLQKKEHLSMLCFVLNHRIETLYVAENHM